jgi:hypothetical protein
VLPILADAFSGNLSAHAMRKFSTPGCCPQATHPTLIAA